MSDVFPLSRIKLGNTPAAGKESVDQAIRFKRLLFERLGRVDGAWLETVEQSGRRGIEAVYDPQDKEAQVWCEQSRDCAKELWQQVKRGAEAARGAS